VRLEFKWTGSGGGSSGSPTKIPPATEPAEVGTQAPVVVVDEKEDPAAAELDPERKALRSFLRSALPKLTPGVLVTAPNAIIPSRSVKVTKIRTSLQQLFPTRE